MYRELETERDVIIPHADVHLAVRDFGGQGPPALLIHGLGASLLAWTAMTRSLRERHRVLAMDLRGHGRSGDGRWSWPDALGDIEAVLDHFGVPGAALIGHSLGGVLAVRYARDHPETSAVVNIDGHPDGDPSVYSGLEPTYVAGRLAQLRREQRMQFARRLTPAQLESIIAATELPNQGQSIRRCLAQRADGTFQLRPGSGVAHEIHEALLQSDLFEIYPRLGCPTLIVCATDPSPAPADLPWLSELHLAHLRGLQRRLKSLVSEHRQVEAVLINASHAALLQDAAAITTITAWLDAATS